MVFPVARTHIGSVMRPVDRRGGGEAAGRRRDP